MSRKAEKKGSAKKSKKNVEDLPPRALRAKEVKGGLIGPTETTTGFHWGTRTS